MKVLVIGSGGREHAIIKKLKENRTIDKIICAPGNGGIQQDAQCFNVEAIDLVIMVELAKCEKVDFCVVTPDDPLAMGMVDILEMEGIPCFGPNANAAIIESSKVFAKNLMQKYHIPTAKYAVFNQADQAKEYIRKQKTYPVVLKADGLALGKGVLIVDNEESAMQAIDDMMINESFGDAGKQIVIEEYMTGPEVSVLAFTDGRTIVPMISSMDHKRANDNDEGLNTGGMGTIAPSPYYTKEIADTCMQTIYLPTIQAMNQEGRKFKGCLYFGLMLTPTGPKVVEYNCRFGDPETQVVLALLKTDLFTIMQAVHDETLDQLQIEWSNDSAACVILASGGYPKAYKKGYEIHGLNPQGQLDGATIYHAGTSYQDGKYLTNGGRVLGVSTVAPTLTDALKLSYLKIQEIQFENMHYRTDIGRKVADA